MHEGNTRIGGWDTTVEKTVYEQKPFNTVLLGSPETKITDDAPLSREAETPSHVNAWDDVRVGDIVEHITFGGGTVRSIDEKYIIVSFTTQEKKFLYPQAFEKRFLEIKT